MNESTASKLSSAGRALQATPQSNESERLASQLTGELTRAGVPLSSLDVLLRILEARRRQRTERQPFYLPE